jgi:hypothetical protein
MAKREAFTISLDTKEYQEESPDFPIWETSLPAFRVSSMISLEELDRAKPRGTIFCIAWS